MAESSHTFVLTLGIDGSGKSTFMNGLNTQLGYAVLEPTSSPEAKRFKAAHLGKPIDLAYIQERQQLFTGLNEQFDEHIREALAEGDVAASGTTLVTNISHAVMRQIVTGREYSTEAIVNTWTESGSLQPDTVVLTYAAMDTIEDRLVERDKAGIVGEKLLGFNSLYFLARYQDALHTAVDLIDQDRPVLRVDSSVVHSAEHAIEQYKSL